jgi:Domain of unknown function (DUF4136)
MSRLSQFTLAAIGTLAIAGCATMNVSSHVQRGLDVSRYHTYDWGPPDALPAGDPRLDEDPFFQDHLRGEVEKAMTLRGFEWSAVGERPDLLVIDVIDARTNRLIWRGWAQSAVKGMLENEDTMARQINEAIARMFEEFPKPL